MIELQEILPSELYELVKFSYAGDNDLWEKYHLENYTLEQAVRRTMDLTEEHKKTWVFKYQKVIFNAETIGYIITTGDFLYSFCIQKDYRTEEVKREWFEALLKELGNNIKIGLMSNNTRAIEFFKKKGMSITWVNPDTKPINEVLLTLN